MIASQPCYGCLTRKDCDIRRSVTKALRGLPVVSARIRCDLPFTRDFPPGTRARVMVWDHTDFDDPSADMRPATVVGPSTKRPGRVLLCLDEQISLADQSKREFVTGWPKDLEKLDEPIRALCDGCRRPLTEDVCPANCGITSQETV